ncbi:MAG TPA: polymer-forming cytoskeletal protein [Thermoanaerobaculia bacterium]
MFTKKPEPRVAAPSEVGRPAAKSGSTVVGPGARFVGDLSGDEDVTVAGRLEGKIRVAEDVKIIAGGEVEGEIEARSVFVGGAVKGQIVASERAELASTAVVEGSVQSPKIIIAEGAQLEGSVAMTAGGSQKSQKEKE